MKGRILEVASTMLAVLLLVITGQAAGQDICNTAPCHCETNKDNGLVIYCRDKGLREVPTWSNSSTSFAELTLAKNFIDTLPNNAFLGLNIRKLDLSDNKITTIEPHTFTGLQTSLEELILHVDNIGSFPTEALSILTNLKAIYLKGFRIPNLPTGALGTLNQLQKVSLVKCGLQSIDTSDFQSFETQLMTMTLAENMLDTVPVSALRVLTNMEQLDLTHNQITLLPFEGFASNKKLSILDLSNNRVTTMHPSAFVGLESSLSELVLQNNLLTNFQLKAVANLSSLSELNVAQNSLTSITMETFTGTQKLRRLNLRGNKLLMLSMEPLVPIRNSLEHFDLAENKLQVVPAGAFQDFSVLKELLMDGQHLNGVLTPDVFSGLENTLQKLTLSSTDFTADNFPSVTGLRALHSLNLKQNNIQVIPDFTFDNMLSLSNLELSSCGLSSVQQRTFHGLQGSLTYINLNGNNLTTMNECVLQGFSKLLHLGLHNNPLQCDCGLLWLRRMIPRIESSGTFIIWRCATPVVHRGKMLRDIPEGDLCSTDPGPATCESFIEETTMAPSPDPGGPTPSLTPSQIPSLIPDGPLLINVTNITHSTANVSWITPDRSDILGFIITYQLYKSSKDIVPVHLGSDVSHYWLRDLQSASKYVICVAVSYTSADKNRNTCSDFTTTNEPSEVVGGSSKTAVIAGAVVGSLVVLAILLILAFLYVRRRNTGDPIFTKQNLGNGAQPSSSSGIPTGIPRIGYNSKRYSRQKGATSTTSNELQNDANRDLEMKLAGFTPDERDRILNLLTNSAGSTLSMISSGSTQRYVPELPPRPQQLEGYLNPQSVKDEYNEGGGHIYDEIPASQGHYYEIPSSYPNRDPPGAVGGAPLRGPPGAVGGAPLPTHKLDPRECYI